MVCVNYKLDDEGVIPPKDASVQTIPLDDTLSAPSASNGSYPTPHTTIKAGA